METAKEILDQLKYFLFESGIHQDENSIEHIENARIDFAIEALKSLSPKMAQTLYEARPEVDITLEECVEKWKNTAWNKVIERTIEELQIR